MLEKNEYYFLGKLHIPKKQIINCENGIDVEFDVLDIINWANLDFMQGNVFKYICRYNRKHEDRDKMIEDLEKAKTYIDRMIETL